MRGCRYIPLLCLASLAMPLPAGSLPAASYSIRLHAQQRGAEPVGMAVAVRVNGGKALRLLVDTGATRILLSEAAARRANLTSLGPGRVFGVGDAGPQSAVRALASSVSIDGLELRDVEVDVSGHGFPPGIDGLLGTAIFRDHLVRLDAPRRRLDLIPALDTLPEALPAMRRGHYVLLPAEAAGFAEGWFLLDTGSEFSVVGAELASDAMGSARMVSGVSGPATARSLGPVEFRIAGQRLWDRNAYALDLSELSRRSGLQIAGLIGFPALRHSVLLIDYRTGRVRIDSR